MLSAWLLGLAALLLQMLTNNQYGYFRDELYFIATSKHLAFGYVDFAPLSSFLLRMNRMLLGESLHALRFLPAVAYRIEVVLTGLIARELGGHRFAIFLASLSVFFAPVVIATSNRYSMGPFEPLFWMGAIYFLLLAINRDQPRQLIWCGLLIGLGLENKHSGAFFLIALLIALAITPERRLYRNKYLWIAAGIIVLCALPNLIWQVQHDFATWVDLSNVKKYHKNIELPPLPFLGAQVMMLAPVGAVIWIAGLGYLLFHSDGRRYRVLGITYLVFLAIMMVLHGKDYYLAPIYPMLFAAGGVCWEKVASVHPSLTWLKITVPAVITASGLVALPIVLPILPVEKIIPYREALGLKMSRTETTMSGPLPQYFGDQFGWEEMVQSVAAIYNALPPGERAKTAILAGNYGEAGAIDFFGPKYGLPPSISAHQNYYLWGYRDYDGSNLIMLSWKLEDAQYWCRDVEVGPENAPQWGMGWEHYTILICHGLKKPLSEAWPHFKVWN
jgi:4-amino-4-deoxy-L-arabinose transferase-like glycosyltransferase